MLAVTNVSQVLSQRSTTYNALQPVANFSYHLYTTSSHIQATEVNCYTATLGTTSLRHQLQVNMALDNGLDSTFNNIPEKIFGRSKCRDLHNVDTPMFNFTYHKIAILRGPNVRRTLQLFTRKCNCHLGAERCCQDYCCVTRPYVVQIKKRPNPMNGQITRNLVTAPFEFNADITRLTTEGSLFYVQLPFRHDAVRFPNPQLQPRAYHILIPISQSTDPTVPAEIAERLEAFLEVTNTLDCYKRGASFNVHLHSCEVAKGGVSLRTAYALMTRSFEYMSSNSSLALAPNFILSTVPGNRELLAKCIFHKNLPGTCIRCLKQVVQQGATPFDCPNVSCPSNVQPSTLPTDQSQDPSLRPGGAWGSRLLDWMPPASTASTKKTTTPPNAVSTGNAASTGNTGGTTDPPSATGTENIADVIGDGITEASKNLEQISVQSGTPEQYNEVTKEPPHSTASLQNPGKRTSTFDPLGPPWTKTQNKDKQTQTNMDYLRPKGKLTGFICSEVEMWMSSRSTIVNCGPIQDTKVVDDLYERLIIQESLSTQLSKDTGKLIGSICSELPKPLENDFRTVINERLDSLETANTELFKDKEQVPNFRQQFMTLKEEMDKKADKSELDKMAKKDKITKKLGDISTDVKKDLQRVTKLSTEVTTLSSLVKAVQERLDKHDNEEKLLTETPATPDEQRSTQLTATQKETVLATQQKAVLSVQQTTSSSPTQIPVTTQVDVPTDGVLSSPTSQVLTTPDIPLPLEVHTPSTISACSTPPRSNSSTPPLLPPTSTHPPELASTKVPPTIDPQPVSENPMGAPPSPKKKRTEKDDPPRRRQAHQRHSSC